MWLDSVPEERAAMDRYYECIDLARKFLMTGVMGLIIRNSLEQLILGFLITIVSLLHLVRVQPYTCVMLNNMQTVSLSVQGATLLYGLILAFQSQEQRLTGAPRSSHLADTIVLLLNLITLFLPPLAVMHEEGDIIRHYLRRKCCCCLPSKQDTVRRRCSSAEYSGPADTATVTVQTKANGSPDGSATRLATRTGIPNSVPMVEKRNSSASWSAKGSGNGNGNGNGNGLHREWEVAAEIGFVGGSEHGDGDGASGSPEAPAEKYQKSESIDAIAGINALQENTSNHFSSISALALMPVSLHSGTERAPPIVAVEIEEEVEQVTSRARGSGSRGMESTSLERTLDSHLVAAAGPRVRAIHLESNGVKTSHAVESVHGGCSSAVEHSQANQSARAAPALLESRSDLDGDHEARDELLGFC